MITELRQAIIEQLQPLASRAKIVGDDSDGEAGSKSQVVPDYIIRVSYSNAPFEPPPITEYVPIQNCTRNFEISIRFKDFRNEDRTVAILEDVENLMIGFCPCVTGSTGGFYLTNDRFVENRDGIYFYVISVAISCFLLKG